MDGGTAYKQKTGRGRKGQTTEFQRAIGILLCSRISKLE